MPRPEDKPIVLFFNGGPGSGTTSGLWTMNTARESLLEGSGCDVALTDAHDNPNSWTDFANLLHVDARGTGYSYCVTENDYDPTVRKGEFNAHNYNAWLDAADFARVLLALFDRFPALRANPVVVAGESYGGTRAFMLLHLLQNYARYADGSMPYQDPALAQALQQHYECIFHTRRGETVPPETIARQFGRQVMIQPAITIPYRHLSLIPMQEPGGPIPTIESETGVNFDDYLAEYGETMDALYYFLNDAGRDYYYYSQPSGWTLGLFTNLTAYLEDPDEFETLSSTAWDGNAALRAREPPRRLPHHRPHRRRRRGRRPRRRRGRRRSRRETDSPGNRNPVPRTRRHVPPRPDHVPHRARNRGHPAPIHPARRLAALGLPPPRNQLTTSSKSSTTTHSPKSSTCPKPASTTPSSANCSSKPSPTPKPSSPTPPSTPSSTHPPYPITSKPTPASWTTPKS